MKVRFVQDSFFVFILLFSIFVLSFVFLLLCSRSRRGRDRMLVGFTTVCAISAYHH